MKLVAFFVCHSATLGKLGLLDIEGFCVNTLIPNHSPLEIGGVLVLAVKCSEHDEAGRTVLVNLLGLGEAPPIPVLRLSINQRAGIHVLPREFRVRPHSTGQHYFELLMDGKKIASYPIMIASS